MTRINLASRNTETRNAASCNSETRQSVSWGRAIRNNASPLVFAAVLIVCSLAVGCSSEKPQPITSNNPAPIAQPASTMATNIAPAPLPEAKPAAKKIVHKRPATLTYTDKTYGVSFSYPRKYALETGDAATALLMASPVPMNFVQPGGVALAAVELPDSVYAETDLSYAFFTVSVNNTLNADQCQEFSVPQTTVSQTAPKSDATPAPASTPDQTASNAALKADSSDAVKSATLDPKLILGELEMHGAEAIVGEGTRQADSKYFHVFQNGACYEFALNLTTNGQATDGTMKHVDRDKVFARLERILSTVKIEADKTEAVKTDASKVDAENADNKGRSLSAETAKPDAVTPDAPKPDTTNAQAPAPVASAAPNTPPASSMPPQ